MAPGKPLSNVTTPANNIQPNKEARLPVYGSEPALSRSMLPPDEQQIAESISIEVPVPLSPKPEFSLIEDLTTMTLPLPLLLMQANQSFLSDLFEDRFLESGTLDTKLEKILQNQHVLLL